MLHLPESILQHAAPFLMVLFRLSGLFVFAPMLSSTTIPARIRLLLALVMAVAVYPTLPGEQMAPVRLDIFTMGFAVIGETLIGLVVGLIASLPLYAVQMGGVVMGQQTGMSLAGVFNPALEVESDSISQLFLYIALAVFVSLGGLELMFLCVAKTFVRVPVGMATLTLSPLELIAGLSGSGFELALRVAAPVLAILLIETVVGGLIMRTLPQINIMSIGYGVKVILAFVTLAAAVVTITPAIQEDVQHACQAMFNWSEQIEREGDLAGEAGTRLREE